MKVLIFSEGTIIMPLQARDMQREEMVKQNLANNPIFKDFEQYVPIGNAVEKIKRWTAQKGIDVYYLTSRTLLDEIDMIKNVLTKSSFPSVENLVYRQGEEEYKDVAERIIPDILIEDDCESIGGEEEMTITHVKPEIRFKIKSIVIPEFGGIDYLPDNICNMLSY